MSRIIVVLLLQSSLFGNDVVIPKGFSQAKLPSQVRLRDVYLDQMKIGDKVNSFSDALFVDKSNDVWLNPKSIGFDPKSKAGKIGNLEIRREKLGYFVSIHYRYKVVDGYSVPVHPKWTPSLGKAPQGYLPVISIKVDKPYYEEASKFKKLEWKMQSPYEPKFNVPAPLNPYNIPN